MSNKRAYFIWLSLHISQEHGFSLTLPIPLVLFLSLSDFLDDIAFFIPESYNKKADWKLSPACVKHIMHTCSELLRELALHTQPLDLIDIDVTDEKSRVAIKCLLK